MIPILPFYPQMLRPSLHPRPPLFTPRLRPPLAIVSAKFDRRRRRPDASTDGFDPWEVISIATTGTPEPAPHKQPAAKTKPVDEGTVEWSSGRPLSGSDVLFAMRRAAAAAAAARKSKKNRGKAKAKASNESEGVGVAAGTEVRPLNVNSDWGRRIEEIESALDQLLKLQS